MLITRKLLKNTEADQSWPFSIDFDQLNDREHLFIVTSNLKIYI
jgi:hypothetical protein